MQYNNTSQFSPLGKLFFQEKFSDNILGPSDIIYEEVEFILPLKFFTLML